MERQTTLLKKEETSNRKCYLVDATDKPLGRLATQIARILIGKNKPSYTPNVDCGDQVIVVNCEKVHLSGNNKLNQKTYYNVSGYTGGMRKRTAKVMLQNYFLSLVFYCWPSDRGLLHNKMISCCNC